MQGWGAWLAATVTAALAGAPAAAAPRVAVDIAPLHAIAARVMAGLGTPELIVPPGASEHDHALRPSEAALLQGAEVVAWIGEALTPWLAQPIAALAPDARVVTVAEAPGVRVLPARAGGRFAAHEHEEHDEHDGHEGHEEGGGAAAHDPHLWLDPGNAAAAAAAIAAALAERDPANADAYAANAEAFAAEVEALAAEIEARVAPVRGRPFVVFHDAYQYFGERFEVPAAGSIATHAGAAPGAARVAEIRTRIAEEGVICVFAEPQFEPKLVATAIEGSDVRSGVLDPLGAGLEPGPGLYPELMRNLADGLVDCLGD
jgi:zinc transport system substrate-binding protein